MEISFVAKPYHVKCLRQKFKYEGSSLRDI